MNKYKRYALLSAFGLVMFSVISIFQHQMYKSNIYTHLQHETHLNESLYHALALKYAGKRFGIEQILKIGREITGAKYFLFDLNSKDFSLKVVSDDILNEISERLQTEHDLSYPFKIDETWHILTFVRFENDSNIFVVSLHESLILQNIHDNRVKQFLILTLISGLLLAFFNKILLYTQNIKIEKDKISLALKESKLYFENAMIGFLIVDKNRKILNVNPILCEDFGYTKSELIGKSTAMLHSSYKNYKECGEQIFLKDQKKSLVSIRCEMKKKNGTTFLVEVSGAPFDKSRELFDDGVVWTVKDITKQVQDEVYLEGKIKEEVSKNLEQAQAYEQEKLRDVKFSAIGQLSAGITHEINTPLTYVKGNLEMLRMDMEDIENLSLKEQLIKDALNLEDGLNRITKIVDSMREMSQQTREIKEKVNIFATLVTALTLAYNRSKQISKIYLNEKEFSINTNKDDFTYICEVQKQRIEQVWIVIINNALDELQKIDSFNERELHIDCYRDNGCVTIKFRDNAGGIDTEILKDIFEPFVSTKLHGGMGVGLSISKKILEEQDATIEVYNENNGAIFEIKLLNCN